MRSPIFQLIVCLLRYSTCVHSYFCFVRLVCHAGADVHKAISFFFFFSLIRETLFALFNKKICGLDFPHVFFSFFLFFSSVWTTYLQLRFLWLWEGSYSWCPLRSRVLCECEAVLCLGMFCWVIHRNAKKMAAIPCSSPATFDKTL